MSEMSVWVAVCGTYSDSWPCGVYQSLRKAKAACRRGRGNSEWEQETENRWINPGADGMDDYVTLQRMVIDKKRESSYEPD